MAPLVPVYEAVEAGLRCGSVSLLRRRRRRRRVSEDEQEKEKETEPKGEERAGMMKMMMDMKGMERAARLRADVDAILAAAATHGRHGTEPASRPRLEALTDRIRAVASSPQTKPYLLLAYAWVLYMALFSGGRFIRTRLRRAGAGFWRRGPVEGKPPRGGRGTRLEDDDVGGDGVVDDHDGNAVVEDDDGEGVDQHLTFWTFDGDEDGEDVKAEFRARFAAVEGTLTEGEKGEVVREAVFVMRSMLEVVGEIKEAIGTGTGTSPAAAGPRGDEGGMGAREEGGPSMRWLLLKHVLPMGMVELIAAGARSAASLGVGIGPSFWSAKAK